MALCEVRDRQQKTPFPKDYLSGVRKRWFRKGWFWRMFAGTKTWNEGAFECSPAECTKIAHRHSLAIFTAEEGIAGNSAARIIFPRFYRRKNRSSLAIFFAEEIAHLGASKSRAIFLGAVKIAAAAAENRAILVHSVPRYQKPERGYIGCSLPPETGARVPPFYLLFPLDFSFRVFSESFRVFPVWFWLYSRDPKF